MSRARLMLIPALLLAACGTPQEQCIRNATAQTRTLDRLIAQSQANLDRGFAYQTETQSHMSWVFCGPGRPGFGPHMCFEDDPETVQVPVAIDPAVETRKLNGLLDKRAGLMKQSQAQVAACKATYPQ